MNLYLLFTVMVFLGAGCSFKNPDNTQKQLSPLASDLILDSDGDGKSDLEERESGSNPLIAEVPIFSGEFFTEMIVTTHFYKPSTNTGESVSFQVRKDIARENGTPIEERDYLSHGSEFLFEKISNLTARNSHQGFHFEGPYETQHIGYFSPPRMNDLKIFPFSKRIFELSQSHNYEEIEFNIANRIHFKYLDARTFSDLVVDLYWYDQSKLDFILIGTDYLKGIYEFNQDYTVPFYFKTNNKTLVKEISETGGRFLYLKIRDFKIIEQDKFYKQIMDKVQDKSIPVLFLDKKNKSIKYIGVNGKFSSLKNLLKTALSDVVQINDSKIVRIGQYNNSTTLERDPYGNGVEVQNKWYLLTNEINNNPLTYSFMPQNVVALSYLSSGEKFNLVPGYFGTVISSDNPRELKTIKIKKNNLMDLRINLRPEEVTFPLNLATQSFPCNQTSLSKACYTYSYRLQKLKGIEALQISSILYITINGIKFRVDELIQKKDAEFRVKNSEVIEIKLRASILHKIPESEGITLSFRTSKTSLFGCTGTMICESNSDSCRKYFDTPPSCPAPVSNSTYNINDQTKKDSHLVTGEAFLSIEYI